MEKDYFFQEREFDIIDHDDGYIIFNTKNLQLYYSDNPDLKEYFYYCNNQNIVPHINWTEEELRNAKQFINELTSEAPPSILITLKHNKKYNIKTVVLPISGKCNLICPYCFARTNDSQFGFDDYTFDNMKKTIDYLYRQWDKKSKMQLVFFGGEPLLSFDVLKKSVEYIKNEYNNWTISYSITTNGTIYNAAIGNFIKQNNIGVLVSIDGPNNEENLRKFKNGRSSVEKVLRNIASLRSLSVPVQLRATLTNECKNIVSIYDFFESINIPFSIVFAYKSGNKEHNLTEYNSKQLVLLKDQFNELQKYYINRIKEGKEIKCMSILEKLSQLKFRIIKQMHCMGGRNMFSIINNGNIFSCEHLVHNEKYSIGNINESGIDVKKLKKLGSIPIDKIKECDQCEVRNLCYGGCFSEKLLCNIGIKNRMGENDCNLIKLQWEHIIKLYSQIQVTCPDFLEKHINRGIV